MLSLKPRHQILIYNRDAAIRKAYATYLNRNGLPTDSCGTLSELRRLLSWYEYEFILINLDSLRQDPALSTLGTSLETIIGEHQADPILIATSSRPEPGKKLWNYSWFLKEPLTPKGILTTISQIRQQQPKTDNKNHLKLRKSLSKSMELE